MSTLDSKVFIKRVHVFKAGPQTSAQGVEREFTPNDLQEVVESYDPGTHEAPLVIGHSGDNDSAPSFGWIKKFVREGDNLYADVNFTDTAKDLVKDGHYRKVSISFYSPNSPINPHQGKWSARHLALLGAAPPAVKGLESLSFSEKEGVFNYAATLSPEDIFDKDLGPTLIIEKSPLEMLKEKLEEVRGEVSSSLDEMKQNQDEQTETEVSDTETTNSADQNTAPENPNQQFSEMKKKMGREGAEASESAQKLANLETQAPEEKFDEGVTRKTAKGAGGQEVQVVQEVYEEGEMMPPEHGELPPALARNAAKMKAKAQKAAMEDEDLEDGTDDEEEEYKELPAAFKKNIAKMKAKAHHNEEASEDMEDDEEGEFSEVSYKTTENGKVSFGKRPGKDEEDPAGRGETARSDDDSYAGRQTVGKGAAEDREGVTSDDEQDKDRVRTARNTKQDTNRAKLAKASEDEAEGESRWADQPGAKKRVMDNDQYDDGEDGLPEPLKPGTSKGNDPHGRDEGPTEVSQLSEEEPDGMEMAVDLENVKNSKKSRVLYNSSGQMRAALKGGAIADHAEGEADGLTKNPKKAGVSDGVDPHGRDDGPTNFPTRSEEDPDDMEMAVDLEDATQSSKVRILRQKSGDKPSVDHAEDDLDVEECEATGKKMTRKYSEVRDPMTKTGKGSTYGQKQSEMEDDEEEEDEEYSETEDFCGMGSMGQSNAMGFPQQMYQELMNLKAENDRLKKEYEEQRTNSRKEKIAQFIEQLYTEGKLTDGIMPQRELQNYCEGLELGTLDFAEGESPTTKLFALLDRLPNMVYFGEVVAEGRYEAPVEEEDLDPHTRALKMVETGECSDYVEALKRCITWGGRG